MENNKTPKKEQFWWKVYLHKLLMAMMKTSNCKQLKVMSHVLMNLNAQNQYIGTIKKTAEKTKVSYKTVQSTFKSMQENNIMVKEGQTGIFRINPYFLMKGGEERRGGLVGAYLNLKNTSTKSDEHPEEPSSEVRED